MANTFVDVNKENYMKALFLDVQKQTKMVNFPDTAKLIHDFVLNNPSNTDSIDKIDKHGLIRRDGYIVIQSRSKIS